MLLALILLEYTIRVQGKQCQDWLLLAVNPKRILKSKARAAAEADRDAKRSKALTTNQALAEAKAAALASGWGSDDDFETLRKR